MRILVVKLSSLGDVIHTLPALSDAVAAVRDLRVDWVVEEAFAEVPGWHPGVTRTIPTAVRRWRRSWRTGLARAEAIAFIRDLRRDRYDLVIDAQGLTKSAAIALATRARSRAGYDRRSAREPLAVGAYGRRYSVPRALHAIERTRRLFAAALDYDIVPRPPDHGLTCWGGPSRTRDVVFLHGATWPNKRWPDAYWRELASLVDRGGFRVVLPAHGDEERLRAEAIVSVTGSGTVLPPLTLTEMADRLRSAAGAVAVDTGLAHLAAAIGTPSVTLFGPTDPALSGAIGPRQTNLAAEFACAPCQQRTCAYVGARTVEPPCFGTLAPAAVFKALLDRMATTGTTE